VDLSGIIFVVLAVAWAVYLIPKALKHHDEVARTRSIDRFSKTMRVLARREPVNRRDARLVVSPPRAADNPRVLTPRGLDDAGPVRGHAEAEVRRPLTPARRAAARAAARRRRRILGFLLLSTAVVTGLAAFGVVPWWSVTIPAGMTLLYLVLCRTQVRRDRDAAWLAEIEAAVAEEDVALAASDGSTRAARVDAAYGTPPAAAVRNAQGFVEVDADDDTLTMPAVVDAVAFPTEDGGSLWDPLPVTLPTYVTKPTARRTVRTISLDDDNTWSSGRSPEDSKLVSENSAPTAQAEEATAAEDAGVQQRAVGS
jgi:hypothetical protein